MPRRVDVAIGVIEYIDWYTGRRRRLSRPCGLDSSVDRMPELHHGDCSGRVGCVAGADGPIGMVTADDGDVSHELGKIKPKQLDEISGMAASRQNPDTSCGCTTTATRGSCLRSARRASWSRSCRFPAAIDDVEDIAIGPGPEAGVDYLYLGDIGDNDEQRREIRIVRFAEPELSGSAASRVDVDDVGGISAGLSGRPARRGSAVRRSARRATCTS